MISNNFNHDFFIRPIFSSVLVPNHLFQTKFAVFRQIVNIVIVFEMFGFDVKTLDWWILLVFYQVMVFFFILQVFSSLSLDPVCWLSFFFLVGKSLSLKLVFYKQAHNSQGLKDFKIQLSFKIFTSEELIRCCMLSIVHVWIWSNIIEKKTWLVFSLRVHL